MSEPTTGTPEQQFLRLYQKSRCDDQRDYYRARHTEYGSAFSQAGVISSVLLMVTAVIGFFQSSGHLSDGAKQWMAFFAVAIPAISTALSSYCGLYMFERLTGLYDDAARALDKARRSSPLALPHLPPAELPNALLTYVEQVEGVLRAEQAQWGQLITQLKMPDLPKETTQAGDEASQG